MEKAIGEFLNLKQAFIQLEETGITKNIQTLRRWIREGKIDAQKTKNRKQGYLIHKQELQRFINESTRGDLRKRILELDRKLETYKKEISNVKHEKYQTEQQEQQYREKLKRIESALRKWIPFINSLNNLHEHLQDMVLNKELPIDLGALIGESLSKDEQLKLKKVLGEDIDDIREQIDDLIELIKHGASQNSIIRLFDVRASIEFQERIYESEKCEEIEREYIQLLMNHAKDDVKVYQLIKQMEGRILGNHG